MFGVRQIFQHTKGVNYVPIIDQLFCLDLQVYRQTSQLSKIFFSSNSLKPTNHVRYSDIIQPIIHGTFRYHSVSTIDKSSLPLDYALEIPAGVITPLSNRHGRIVRKNKADIEQIIDENFAKIQLFAESLGCSFEEMADLVRKDTRLVTSLNEERVLQTINVLKQYGYCETEILSNPPAFCLSIKTLESRLKEMKEVRCSRLYVMKYGRKHFLEILKFYEKEKQVMKGFTSRESFLAALFGCEEDDVVAKSVKFTHLSTYPVSRLNAAFQLMVHWGYQQKEIWNDLDTLVLPPQEIQYRLNRMNTVGLIHKDKVFSLLHPINKNQFEQSVVLWVEDQAALGGHPDLTSLLGARLQCAASKVEKMYRHCDTLRQSRPRGIKAKLDILLEDLQIPPYFIIMRPVVLMYSLERLKCRQKILEAELVSNPRTLVAALILPAKLFDKKYNIFSEQDSSA